MSAQDGTLGYDGPNPSWWERGSAPLAGLTELNTEATEGREVLSWFYESGEKPDVSRAGERLRGLRGHWVSNTVMGLPWQPSGSPSRRHPGADGQKKKDLTMEGSKTSLKTTGSASCRVVSKKPEDRPTPRRAGGAGLPQAGGRALLLAAAGTPVTRLPRYCLCPTEYVQRARQTAGERKPLSQRQP